MSDVSAVLSLPYLLPAQAQKHVTHNEALGRLDVAVQLAVIARDLAVPPADPGQGDRYLVPAGASGDWAGRDGEIAVYDMNTWVFQAPVAGWSARVLSEDAQVRFDGTAWQDGLGALHVDTLGVNGAADATNRLMSVAPATLLTHDGAGHQLKVNKAAETDTASLLFQTDWSGRAEMGTTGTDEFAIKVSADGAAWQTALAFDGASGTVSGAAVQNAPTDTGAGKLARADYAYGPGNLLGGVAQAGGIPTGAVLESGTNANGSYLRLADGTQICWQQMPSSAAGQTLWLYPAGFAAGSVPIIQATAQVQTAHFASTGAPSAAGVNFSVWGLSAARVAYATGLLAIGRWI
ncbi:ribonuclease III (plasmid) [Antarctobacter heliothermus]|uniref:Ribonuclease III n=1 Tax=Antarctobacter heliothermus TaxID=74033 RepID=A0A222EBU4_9RHOB|nr:DUF2793 domain-containing protein [Antarctobacter heliothermus]ASP23570.1 ribonuclease III [Antarctobacter heliothermus]